MSDEHQFHEVQYRIAMEAAGLGMWYWDLVQNRQEWSKECKAILGVSENAQGSYEYFLSLIYPEDYERVQALLAESHRTRTSYVTEYRIIWPGGSLHWVADRGKLGLSLYICRELIRLHGGCTGVDSIVDQGSTFWFTLPVNGERN